MFYPDAEVSDFFIRNPLDNTYVICLRNRLHGRDILAFRTFYLKRREAKAAIPLAYKSAIDTGAKDFTPINQLSMELLHFAQDKHNIIEVEIPPIDETETETEI